MLKTATFFPPLHGEEDERYCKTKYCAIKKQGASGSRPQDIKKDQETQKTHQIC